VTSIVIKRIILQNILRKEIMVGILVLGRQNCIVFFGGNKIW